MARVPFWLGGDKEEKEDSIELKPEEVKGKLDKIDSLESDMKEVKGYKATLDDIASFVAETRQQRADAIAARQAELDRKRAEKENEGTPVLEGDADIAVTNKLRPLQLETNRLRANETVRNLLEAGEFEYYSGAIRAQMQNLIENGVKAGAEPTEDWIKNCYYVAEGRNRQEIKENKIKSRFSSSTSPGTGNNEVIKDNKALPKLTDEEKYYAKITGVSEEDYAKNKQELNYV